MPRTKDRFFANKLSDFGGTIDELTQEAIYQHIDNLLGLILKNAGCGGDSCEGGVYVGLAGVAYSLWYLSTKPKLADKKDFLLSTAKKFIDTHQDYLVKRKRRYGDEVGLLLGEAGIHMVQALISQALGKADQKEAALKAFAKGSQIALESNLLPKGSDELLVGRAGYLLGVLNLQLKLGKSWVGSERIGEVCKTMVDSGLRYSKKNKSASPLMYAYHGTEYLGAAHGLSSILQMLISFPDIYEKLDKTSQTAIKESIKFFLSIQHKHNGNFPCAVDEIVEKRPIDQELFHWCHGSPGVVYLMGRAYHLWKDKKYLESCIKCAEGIWQYGLLKKGPGVCHGVAGNAYAFLLLYQLTQDAKYLHRAHQFAKFMLTEDFRRNSTTPDSPYSLYEGIAGTLCFFADLLDPRTEEFPLFPVLF